jgi:iron(III) transport system substrate-binding protein
MLIAAAAGLLIAACAAAEKREGPTAADLALYDGADRMQRLVEGAKREGAISIYTSAQAEDLGPLVSAFERKYGIPVTLWRSGSEGVLHRAVQEARGNRFTVDVIETNGPEMESLHREEILQLVKSPTHADLLPTALRQHGEWVATRFNVFVQAYNTKLVRKEDLPKTWEDLRDPKWKGKLAVEQEDADWLAGLFGDIGMENGRRLFGEIAQKNGIVARKGHTLLTQLVVSGEVPMALTVYNYKAEQLKSQGAPIDWFVIGKAVARPNGVGVTRRAPHPHAAVLFYDFELSKEGQQLIAGREFVPTSRLVDTPLNKMPMTLIEPRVIVDEYDKWVTLYQELFGTERR